MRRRHRLLLAPLTLLLLCTAAVRAQPAQDPLQSPECQRAMAALQAEEAASAPPAGASAPARREALAAASAASAASSPSIPPHLAALRRAAARACLGTHADVLPAPQRALQPPVAIQAPALPGPVRVPRLPAPAVTLPAEPPRPSYVTSCDPGGCWASDGSRLQRAGPNLIGPRGFCTQQGALLSCP
jgi:hypothetical protein